MNSITIGYLVSKTKHVCTVIVPYYKYNKKYKKVMLSLKKYQIKDYRNEGTKGDLILFNSFILCKILDKKKQCL